MSVKCGHCKGRHVYVSDVKECAEREAAERYEAEWEAAEAQAEYEAERAAERFWEEGTPAQRDQYAWEVEQDERNAEFWGGPFIGFDGQPQGHPPIWR